MPIRPENRHRYPKNWKEIRAQILDRAGHRCETAGCRLKNHSHVLRFGQWFCPEDASRDRVSEFKDNFPLFRRVKVILTIAHLDHTPENNDPSNLRAWCQKCHNQYDAPHRAANRRKNAQASKR